MNQQFSRAFKINKSSQYASVFNSSDFRVSSPYVTFIVKKNKSSNARIGIIVAKKNIRRAVDRNLAKRVIKESFRRDEVSKLSLDIVVIVRSGSLLQLSKKQKINDLTRLWQSLIKKSGCKKKEAIKD